MNIEEKIKQLESRRDSRVFPSFLIGCVLGVLVGEGFLLMLIVGAVIATIVWVGGDNQIDKIKNDYTIGGK
jgi:hypothetical protein